METKKKPMVLTILKWLGRIVALLLFLFWGAFFLEHISEWFLHPDQGFPPLRVWISQGFHLIMLIGLLMMVKWDKLGALITVVGTVAFFSIIGMSRFPVIALLNLLPIGFFGGYWLSSRSAGQVREK